MINNKLLSNKYDEADDADDNGLCAGELGRNVYFSRKSERSFTGDVSVVQIPL